MARRRGRKPNAVKTIDLTLAATPKLMAHLRAFVKTEMFGHTEAAVALTLLRERVRELRRDEVFGRRKS